jgi:CheY-like chemotaxis protein
MGRTELLHDRLAPEDPMRRDLTAIHNASARGAWLVRQLLAFSRQEIAAPQVLDLRSVVSEIRELMRSMVGEKIQLEVRVCDEPARVRVDRAQIEQVLVNLVINARDAMQRGGHLTLEVDRRDLEEGAATAQSSLTPGPYVTLSVSDTGHGMDEETRAHLFEPFFTTKSMEKGSGLGLSIVYGIVTHAGGHVQVGSEPGRGTSVTVHLPRVEESDLHEAAHEAAEVTTGRQPLVLLVEDDDSVRAVAREALEMDGFRVIEAQSGPVALRCYEETEESIDLVISDVVMPEMSGGELVQHIARIRDGVRVLLVSGYTNDAIVRQGIQSGLPFLQKPFSLDSLSRKVREVLDAPPPRLGFDRPVRPARSARD